MDNRPIGVFDSGVGGLTVLDSLMDEFPNESFIYVADQGHCPYGTKPEKEISNCACNVAKWLVSQNVKAIVIACNTASLFIEDVKNVVDIPVISVIDPTAKYAFEQSNNKYIGVIATIATINKGAYNKKLTNLGATVHNVPCSEFVDFIENHDLDEPYGKNLVHIKLQSFKDTNIDTLIYGCTHFSIIENLIKQELGNINYIACGYPTSIYLKELLSENKLLSSLKNRNVLMYTTGEIENFKKTSKWFTKPYDSLSKIHI